jgi:hypothetical protein
VRTRRTLTLSALTSTVMGAALCVLAPAAQAAAVVNVSTPAQLAAALANASAGQTIQLAAGTYDGMFLTQKSGTASAPITLTGPSTAVLSNANPVSTTTPSCSVPTAGFNPGYGLWLYNASYWNLRGFTVANAKKGVMVDKSSHVTVDGLRVHAIGAEGIHFRTSSADGVVRDSIIEDTGRTQPEYGEGIYLGSAKSNWACYAGADGVDHGDRAQILGNRIGPDVRAEHIDVKEGTLDGVISGNTFNGTGIAGQNSADSWIDVKGTGYRIEGNTGTFRSPGTFANGYETHNPVTGSGCGNVWRNNKSDLGGVGDYAVKVTSTSKCKANPNVVYASNTVSNAKEGLTNVPVTP